MTPAVALLVRIAGDGESREFDRRAAAEALNSMGLTELGNEKGSVGEFSLAMVIREIDKLHCLGDAIYDVRAKACEAAMERGGKEFDSWQLPEVVQYSSLLDRLNVLLDEDGA